MTTVTYSFEFNYLPLNSGSSPNIQITVASLVHPDQAVDIDACLDSGTLLSLFDGRIATSIGIELLSGRPKTYTATSGASIEARLHRVRISREDIGDFDLEAGFSLGEIQRNLLGRDFFALVQIGFRERQRMFYVTPSP